MLEAIKELRARTHLGMTACKQALETCAGDVEKAIEHLQKQGTIRRAEELAEAKEGIVLAQSDEQSGLGCIIEVNCQTDFAARSDLFKEFARTAIGTLVIEEGKAHGVKYEDSLVLCSKQLGESVIVKRREMLAGKTVRAYNHHSGKIAVLLAAECQQETPETLEFLDECAMQIAANNPLGLNREDIASEEATQRAIFAEQVPLKAEKMKDKIVQGKVDKWYQDVVLIDQESIVHSKKTISQLKNELEVKTGAIHLVSFIRYELGH